MTRKASIGTVSAGTLCTADLLDMFALELDWLSGPDRATEHTKLIAEVGTVDPNSEEALELLNELIEVLDHFAPEGCYFGAHEGDGADFGFWPLDDRDDLQPCTREAVNRGCVCGWSRTHSASIDPPHEVISKHCPLHGSEDPDGDYDRERDEPIVPFLEEGDY